MSMIENPHRLVLTCGESITKSNVGMEYDINRLVKKYKKSGKMPKLTYYAGQVSDDDGVIDLTVIGDFMECQNRIAKAKEMFEAYPSPVRRRFDNDPQKFMDFMNNLKEEHNVKEAEKLGLLTIKKVEQKTPVDDKKTPPATAN